jgi:tRNA(Ile2) C34 agmatinyltransferase TiaS
VRLIAAGRCEKCGGTLDGVRTALKCSACQRKATQRKRAAAIRSRSTSEPTT